MPLEQIGFALLVPRIVAFCIVRFGVARSLLVRLLESVAFTLLMVLHAQKLGSFREASLSLLSHQARLYAVHRAFRVVFVLLFWI